jgi:5'(3')-deoxyribonucleotidase
MIKTIEEKRKWISDRLIQFVDIVFGVVVGQSILRNIELINKPLSFPFAMLALFVVITTVSLSWIGYHKSMYKYPYKADIYSINIIRPFSDFIIVVIYTLLLFTVDSFKTDSTSIILYSFIFYYALIFILYIADGYLRIFEYRDQKASRLKLSYTYLLGYIILFIVYYFAINYLILNHVLVNFLTLIFCGGLYMLYRFKREPHYHDQSIMTLVVDIDGVLADQVTPVLDSINKKFGSKYTKEDIRSWDQKLPLAHTDIKTEIENSHNNPSFVENMVPIRDAQKVLMELSKYCEITIATQRTRNADKSTKKWLKKHNIPYNKYVNTNLKGKGSAKGNILIDDYPKNVLDFIQQERTAFIFTQPWNENDQSIIGNDRIIRVNSWNEILEEIKSL